MASERQQHTNAAGDSHSAQERAENILAQRRVIYAVTVLVVALFIIGAGTYLLTRPKPTGPPIPTGLHARTCDRRLSDVVAVGQLGSSSDIVTTSA